MEISKKSKEVYSILAVALALGGSACLSTVHTNNNVMGCNDNGTNVEATLQPGKPGYEKSTDPYLIDKALHKYYQEHLGSFMDEKTAGMGIVTCINRDNKQVLTVRAVTFEREHPIS